MSSGRTVPLNTGARIPALGYGTWQSSPDEVGDLVYEALKVGYRHLDFAKVYGNQKEAGKGIKRAINEIPGLKREDIFITSKLWNDCHQPENVAAALDDTLRELDIDYLDLYLIHWPVAFIHGQGLLPIDKDGTSVILDKSTSISQTWKAMTNLPKAKTRAVGVSNFTVEHLENIIKATGITPASNQIERHPRLIQENLVEYCAEKGILLTAYSAFGNNTTGIPLLINNDKVKAVAKRLDAAPAKVLLAWAQVGGHAVISKSVAPSRIRENFQEIELEDEDIRRLDEIGLDRHRFNIPVGFKPKWDVDCFGEASEAAATSTVILCHKT